MRRAGDPEGKGTGSGVCGVGGSPDLWFTEDEEDEKEGLGNGGAWRRRRRRMGCLRKEK
jgi:hypothetical protein